MPKFFLPYIEDAEKAEEFWQAIKAFAIQQGWSTVTDRRIFHLDYTHNGSDWTATVGEPHPYGHPYTWEYVPDYSDPKAGQWVVAILECDPGPFLVCTHDRGVARGEPILVGASGVRTVAYFDGYEPSSE